MQGHKALSRRTFIVGCGAMGATALVAIGSSAGASVAVADEPGGASGQYGFLVDMDKCVGCKKCVEACRAANHLAEDAPDRRRVEPFLNSRGHNVYVSTSCMHCADPNCMRVCPAGAISKGAAGLVTVNKERCIGCKYCFQACPYGVPRYDAVSMDKCDGCVGAGVAPGDTPYCVQNCLFDALQYGPIDELKAAHPEAVAVGEACDPSCVLVGERG